MLLFFYMYNLEGATLNVCEAVLLMYLGICKIVIKRRSLSF